MIFVVRQAQGSQPRVDAHCRNDWRAILTGCHTNGISQQKFSGRGAVKFAMYINIKHGKATAAAAEIF
jgi:hypothetical protein